MIKRLLVAALLAAMATACRENPAPAPAADAVVEPSADSEPQSQEGSEPSAPSIRDPDHRRRLLESEREEETHPVPPAAIAANEFDARLEEAELALSQGQGAAGEGAALAIYLSILTTQDDHPEALAGRDRLTLSLLERGGTALAQGEVKEARQIANLLARIQPATADIQAYLQALHADEEILLLMETAKRLQEASVWVGEGDSAASVYQEVLRLRPDHEQARLGLLAVEKRLIEAATSAAEAGDYRTSDVLLADAASVASGSGATLDASTRIVEMRQKRAAGIVEQANARILAGQLDDASAFLVELERVSAKSEGIEDLRQRIESARLYGGLRPGQRLRDRLRSGQVAPEVVVIPVGEFRMGSAQSENHRRPNEGPQHAVRITRGFALGRYEVTVAEFRAFVEATGFIASSQSAGRSTIYDEKSGSMRERRGVSWKDDYLGRDASENMPVVHVSWGDAVAYLAWLTSESGQPYRLPSEAEFEYALRAGSESAFPWGDEGPTVYVGNLTGDGDRSSSRRNWVNAFPNYADGYWGPAPVGQFDASPFGLHDMVGNVIEWVEDCWHDSYQRAPTDGSAWVNPGCNRRVIRGASWASAPDQVRSAFRANATPETTNARLGFRVARDLSPR